MDEVAIRAALDDCLVGLLKPTIFDPAPFRQLADPFPTWERGLEEA